LDDKLRVSIHQPHYFPYLGYLYKLKQADIFVYLDNAQYEKNGFINRNRIKINGKPYWLTVPVLTKGKFGQLIKEVKVNWDREWNLTHYDTLRYNYPDIKDKLDNLRGFFLFEKNDFLIDWNIRSIDFLCNAFKIRTERIFESDLGIEGNSTKRLYNICKKLKADTYLSGPSGRNYLDESIFKDIKIEYMDWRPKTSMSALHHYLKNETRIFTSI